MINMVDKRTAVVRETFSTLRKFEFVWIQTMMLILFFDVS